RQHVQSDISLLEEPPSRVTAVGLSGERPRRRRALPSSGRPAFPAPALDAARRSSRIGARTALSATKAGTKPHVSTHRAASLKFEARELIRACCKSLVATRRSQSRDSELFPRT